MKEAALKLDLSAMVRRGQENLTRLNELAQQVAELDRQRAEVEGQIRLIVEQPLYAAPTPGERFMQKPHTGQPAAHRKMGDVLVEIMRGKAPMSLDEAWNLAQEAGVQSKSAQPKQVLRQTFKKDRRFRKFRSRGQKNARYAVKAGK